MIPESLKKLKSTGFGVIPPGFKFWFYYLLVCDTGTINTLSLAVFISRKWR